MGDLVCVRIIFPKPLVIEFFLLTYNGVFFYSFIRHKKGENFFHKVVSRKIFLPSKSVCTIFFLKSPIPPLESQMVGPLSAVIYF